MENELSKTVVLKNGEVLDINKVQEVIFLYWQLNATEQRSFDRLCKRNDLIEKFHKGKL